MLTNGVEAGASVYSTEAIGRLQRSFTVFSGYRCSECGAVPPQDERETFYDSGLCGWCRTSAGADS